MPKCASTWLQREFFKPRFGYRLRYGPIESQLAFVDPPPGEFNKPGELWRLHMAGGMVPTVSAERLAGNPLDGGSDQAELVRRLQKTLPKAKILIVIREQRSMYRSLYKLLVNWGAHQSPRQLLLGESAPGGVIFRRSFLAYDRMIEAYINAFGHGNVLVMPFEEFQREPVKFLQKISAFSGAIKVTEEIPQTTDRIQNPGRSLSSLALKRYFNRWVARTPGSPRGIYTPKKIHRSGNITFSLPPLERILERRFRTQSAAVIDDTYRQSNSRVEELTGLDLSVYGYALSGSDN